MILTIQDEEYGDLDLYNGYQDEVIVGCDTTEGYDLLVYTPDLNYVGPDAFVVQYCVDGEPDDCMDVVVNIQVEEDDDDNLPLRDQLCMAG